MSNGGNSKQRRQYRKLLERKLGEQAAAQILERQPGQVPPADKRPKHAVLVYLRASGAVGILLGIGLTVSSILFWWGAGFLYAALVIGLIDLVVERGLTEVTKIVFGSVIVAVGLLFTYGIVAFRAPLKLQSNWNPQGAAVNGIDWKSGMSALVVYITNPTDRDYDDLDISLWVSEAIVTVKQGTDIPCEHVSRDVITAPGGWNHLLEMGPQRFRCDKLPRDSTIEFVIALVNADQLLNSKNLRPGDKLPQGLFGPKRKPHQFGVVANYTVTFRPHTVSTLVAIN